LGAEEDLAAGVPAARAAEQTRQNGASLYTELGGHRFEVFLLIN
jgi:hypothetical protein